MWNWELFTDVVNAQLDFLDTLLMEGGVNRFWISWVSLTSGDFDNRRGLWHPTAMALHAILRAGNGFSWWSTCIATYSFSRSSLNLPCSLSTPWHIILHFPTFFSFRGGRNRLRTCLRSRDFETLSQKCWDFRILSRNCQESLDLCCPASVDKPKNVALELLRQLEHCLGTVSRHHTLSWNCFDTSELCCGTFSRLQNIFFAVVRLYQLSLDKC